MQTPDRPSQGCTEPHASATRSAVQSRQPSGGLFQQTKQQRTIDKLRKKLTKERKRRSKIQGKLKLSQEQSLQLQEALNAANKENERLETAREAQVLHKTNFTKPLSSYPTARTPTTGADRRVSQPQQQLLQGQNQDHPRSTRSKDLRPRPRVLSDPSAGGWLA